MRLDSIYRAEVCLKKRKELAKVLQNEGTNCNLRITVLSGRGEITFTTDHNCVGDRDLQRAIYKALRDRLQALDKDIEEL